MKNYVFVDESPTLSKNDNFDYFCLACFLVKNDGELKKIRRIPKKIKNTNLKKRYKNKSELKFSNSPPNVRKEFLTKLNKCDLEIFCLIINKNKLNHSLQTDLTSLYNYLMNILLEKTFESSDMNKELEINLDRCMNQKQIKNLTDYLNSRFLCLFSQLPKVRINHLDSVQEKCLQAADFIAGSFRFEYNEKSKIYTGIIKDRIKSSKIIR